MLTIYKAANPEYYVDYLDKDKKGIWAGYLKEVWGLPEIVTEEHYWNLIKGYSPNGKIRLFQDNGKEHLGAQDFTFSACKSVSLVMVENKEEIVDAHESAVNAAIHFLEQKVAYTRRGKNGVQLEKVHGLLVSKHTHFDSRAGQPQLHTHCLIFNQCQRKDGSWGTLSYRHFYKWKMAVGAIYRCQFAQNLRALGYELRTEGDFFEIDGISSDLLKKYSQREQEITEKLNKLRLENSSSNAGNKVVLTTRKPKPKATNQELFSRWSGELKNILTPKRSLANAIGSAQMYVLPSEVLKKITIQKTYFREQDLFHQLAIKGQSSFLSSREVTQIANRTIASNRVIPLGLDKNSNQCYSTPEALHAEQVMIGSASDMAISNVFTSPKQNEYFEKGLIEAEADLGFSLENEQLETVKMVTSPQRLVLIQGTAGTGKSTSFRAAKYIYEVSGRSIVGASVSKKAADSLADSAKIKAFTVDMLIAQYSTDYNPLKNHAALIVDEASLLNVFQLNMLFKMANESKTKVVLAGDIFQLQAIEQPGAFNYLLKNNIAPSAELEHIRRQENDWAKSIVNQFKIGNALPALDALNSKGFVKFEQGYEETVCQLVNSYFELQERQPEKNRLVLAQSWRDVKAISQLIRGRLQEKGVVKSDAIELNCSVSDKVFKQQFAIGDRVRLSKNNYSLKLSNGMQGELIDISKEENDNCSFKIKLDNGRLISISTSEYKSDDGYFPLVQAYASTIYSAQGLTVDGDTLILANSYFDRANTYVAGSRHKKNCYWFFNTEETDIALLDEQKSISETTRLYIAAKWCAQENDVKLASEFLPHEQVLTNIYQPSL